MELKLILKVAITAIVIVAISEVAKHSKPLGAIIASLPLTSLLALTWLYLDTSSVAEPAELSMQIFYAVIPSLVFFPALTALLKWNVGFPLSMLLSALLTAGAYTAFFWVIRR